MNSNSGKFFVGSTLLLLLVLGLILFILSSMLNVGKNVTAPASMESVDIEERIKPVAEVNIGEAPVVVAAAPAESSNAIDGPGKNIVDSVCATCHASGLMNAPKLGNVGDWAPRIEKGVETLYVHSLEGFNAMPAKGGRTDLPDDDIKAAVDYMLGQVGAAPAGSATTTDAAATTEESAPVANTSGADEATLAAGKAVVEAVCATCHATGLMRAPKLGNADDWAPRIEKGIETLYKHSLEGFQTMPAKGGRADLPDADVKAAVDYMIHTAQ